MPRSCGLMRPSAVTAVASVNTSAAPPTARPPRWTRCQSVAKPSSHEYWHIGETRMRWASSRERSRNGSKRGAMAARISSSFLSVARMGWRRAPAGLRLGLAAVGGVCLQQIGEQDDAAGERDQVDVLVAGVHAAADGAEAVEHRQAAGLGQEVREGDAGALLQS